MNRRNFLKSIATVCGAAVVCPGELLKSPVAGIDCSKPVWWTVIDCSDEKFQKAFKKHKFRPPVPKGTRLTITQGRQGRGGWVIFRETLVYYQENLST